MTYTVTVAVMLAVLCILPLLVGYVLTLLPSKPVNGDDLETGNPFTAAVEMPPHVKPVMEPLIHLMRYRTDKELREAAQGLRHFPIQDTAPLLQRLLLHEDPMLQIFAQSILQDKQEDLQKDFANRAMVGDERAAADRIRAGLNLVQSPLTPDTEKPAILKQLLPLVEAAAASGVGSLPRLWYAAGCVSLLLQRLDLVERFIALLPPGSPFQDDLIKRLNHQAAILLVQKSA